MKLSFSCSWRTEKTAVEYPRCIHPAGSSCTSAEASTTSRGSAVPSARAPPLVLKGRRLERNRKCVHSLLEGSRIRTTSSGSRTRLAKSEKSDICDRKCAVGLCRPSSDSPKLGRAS
jgi:hypothetical protein